MLSSALFCLALNIYHEARGDGIDSQYGVAYVTMNRAEWKERKVCEEVFKPHQFSWTNNIKMPSDKKSWNKSVHIAKTVLKSNPKKSNVGKSTFYHHKSVKPKWSRKFKFVTVKGTHIFYERPKYDRNKKIKR